MSKEQSDEIKILCPKCGGDDVEHESSGYFRCHPCMDNLEHGDYLTHFSSAASYAAQLQEARRQIAEKDQEIQALGNDLTARNIRIEEQLMEIAELKATWTSPEAKAATNRFHDEELAKVEMANGSTIASLEMEIAALKAERLKPIDEAKTGLMTLLKLTANRAIYAGLIQALDVLDVVRAKYQGG